jgi:hypothetical protein
MADNTAFRPLETALLNGVVDAIFTQGKVTQHLMEATGKLKAIEDLSRYPDWTLQVTNVPAVVTCTDVMAEEHPELVVTFMKGKNDFDVTKWAAPKFLEQAAKELLEEQWKKVTTAKLPEATQLLAASRRTG